MAADLPVTQREQSAIYKALMITVRYMPNWKQRNSICAQTGPIVAFLRAVTLIAYSLDTLEYAVHTVYYCQAKNTLVPPIISRQISW